MNPSIGRLQKRSVNEVFSLRSHNCKVPKTHQLCPPKLTNFAPKKIAEKVRKLPQKVIHDILVRN